MMRRTMKITASNQSTSTSTSGSTSLNRIQVLRKKVEANRAPMLRENVNKITAIASADMKFINDVFSELDTIHKSMFESFGKKKDTKDSVSITVVDDDSDNIFKKD